MAPHIKDLVAALVRRLQSSKIAGLRSSLLLIFARLVYYFNLFPPHSLMQLEVLPNPTSVAYSSVMFFTYCQK